MEALRIDLDHGADGETQGTSLILMKLLVFEDFRAPYGGTALGLAGAAVAGGWGGATRLPPLCVHPRRGDTVRILDFADEYLSRPGGYGRMDDVLGLFASARCGSGPEPLAFFAAAEHRRRFEAFLARVGRECSASRSARRLSAI